MKKSVLTLSIAAAVAGLGFVGGAQAMIAPLAGATGGSDLLLNQDGIGHMLMIPYYSAQGNNSTLVNLVNTDTVNGKAVKVRFRGAANSDDVFDFQVFLSPADVFTFNVSQNAAGQATLTTNDNSCTKPSKAVLNTTPFVTSRLDSTLGAAGLANGTREGYIEVFNMADVPPTIGVAVNPLFTAIKHDAKVAPCKGAAWTALDTDLTSVAATAAGLAAPTTGLMGNTLIVNVVGAAAWSADATAIQAVVAATGAPAAGNVVYWPQTGFPVGVPAINDFTADPLLRSADVYNASLASDPTPAVAAAFYDLPDFSTPYTAAAALSPLTQAVDLTRSIAASSASNEFLTDPAIAAKTDWTFSMPTRRYNVSLDYAAIGAGDDGRRFTDLFATAGLFTTAYFNPSNTLVTSRQVCVKGIIPKYWDREETTVASSILPVVSPSTPAAPLSFCGEASVLSINNGGILATGTGALNAQVATKDIDVGFVDGWMMISTPSATIVPGAQGLPLLGSAYNRASTNGVQTFGASHAHRFGR